MSEEQEMYTKITLDSGRTVLLKPLKIKYYKSAAHAASKLSGNNQVLLSMYLQDELVKILMVQLDGKDISAAEKEAFDNIFNPEEYRQVMMIVEEIIGNVERPKVEVVSYSGSK